MPFCTYIQYLNVIIPRLSASKIVTIWGGEQRKLGTVSSSNLVHYLIVRFFPEIQLEYIYIIHYMQYTVEKRYNKITIRNWFWGDPPHPDMVNDHTLTFLFF